MRGGDSSNIPKGYDSECFLLLLLLLFLKVIIPKGYYSEVISKGYYSEDFFQKGHYSEDYYFLSRRVIIPKIV